MSKELEFLEEKHGHNSWAHYPPSKEKVAQWLQEWIEKQFAIHSVVSSLPSKEAMNKKVNTLIFENFEDDEIANRREYGFGFRACYRWILNELKHK